MLRPRTVLLLLIAVSLSPPVAEGRDGRFGILPRRFHPWARFRVGAWKEVRISTETLDGSGQVKENSTTVTKTVMEKATEESVSLHSQAVLEIAGKTISPDPRVTQESFLTDAGAVPRQVKIIGEEQLQIDGKPYLCQVRQSEEIDRGKRVVTNSYVCDSTEHYVLREETVFYDPKTGAKLGQITSETVSLDKPFPVCGRLRRTALVKTVQELPNKGTTISWSIQDSEVPGNVVFQSTWELDGQNRLVRNSKLELVNFAVP